MPGKYSDKKRDKIWRKVFGWYGAFACSDHFMSLTESEMDEAEFIVVHFAEFMYIDNGLAPKQWNMAGMKVCCTESLPREIASGPEYFKSVVPVLSAFFRFLEETGLLLSAGLLVRGVERLGPAVVENAANPDMWGPAKAIVETAKEAGLDMNSREEINLFMQHCNQQMGKESLSDSTNVLSSDGPLVIGRIRQPINGNLAHRKDRR
ncbi:MAG: hypothetical protein HQL87_08565 [Magnetococcales bacterium]|nr:hypothetical protein [Magnetococcales bacterium]